MTLILTLRTGRFVIQASDRRVSKTNSRGAFLAEHNPEANKSLVYLAADSLLTLGYTGPAYIGGKTTDHWIADTMRGEPFPQEERRLVAYRSYVPNWRKRHAALSHLASALDYAYQTDKDDGVRKEVRGVPTVIMGTGWNINRKGLVRTFIFGISKNNTRVPAVLRYFSGRDPIVTAAGSGRKRAIAYVQDRLAYRGDPLPEAQVLADAIRMVSEEISEVGPDVLTVILSRPWTEGGSGIAYFTDDYNAPCGISGIDLPRFYSPWVLTQDCTWHPSRVWGFQFELGRWLLDVPMNQTDYNGRATYLMAPLRSPPDLSPRRSMPRGASTVE